MVRKMKKAVKQLKKAAVKFPERFCVIGATSGGMSSHSRKWFKDAEKAAQHAKGIIESRKLECELYVAQVVAAVKRPTAPTKIAFNSVGNLVSVETTDEIDSI